MPRFLQSLLLGGILWAQLPLTPLERVGVRLVPALSSSGARTQTVWLVDSLYYDEYGSGWQAVQLHTYSYFPSNQQATDSLFRWTTGGWLDSALTRYAYYLVGSFAGQESLQVTYETADGSTWDPADSLITTFSPFAGGYWQEQIAYSWSGSTWQLTQRVRTKYNGTPPQVDSTYLDTFNVSTSTWETIAKGRTKYDSQGKVDSVFFLVTLSTNFVYVQNIDYDAQGRMSYLRDTLYIPSYNLPFQATEDFLTYTSATSTQIAVDSLVIRSYLPFPNTSIYRYLHTYDANDNLAVRLEEDCSSPPCAPVSRERYAWEQGVATGAKPAIGKVRALPNPLPAGSYLPLDGAEGQAYRIIDLQGRLWQSGEVPSHHPLIPLPTEPGLYLLQIGGTQHKLLLLR